MSELLSLLPVSVRLQVARSSDHTIECHFTTEAGVDIDITLDTVTAVVRDSIGGTVKVNLSNAVGAHSDPTHGKTRFTFTKTHTNDAKTSGTTTWALVIIRTLPSLAVVPWWAGPFEIHEHAGPIPPAP